jgi:hypothetical protein
MTKKNKVKNSKKEIIKSEKPVKSDKPVKSEKLEELEEPEKSAEPVKSENPVKSEKTKKSNKKTKKKKKKSFFESQKGKRGLKKANKTMLLMKKIAYVFFGGLLAYVIQVFIELIAKILAIKHFRRFPIFVQKYIIYPTAVEIGMFLSIVFVLYLLGRLMDYKVWPTLIGMIILVHLIDFTISWVIETADIKYIGKIPVLTRIPGVLLTVLCGYYVLKWALIREKGE